MIQTETYEHRQTFAQYATCHALSTGAEKERTKVVKLISGESSEHLSKTFWHCV
jgi:hypothetical protein